MKNNTDEILWGFKADHGPAPIKLCVNPTRLDYAARLRAGWRLETRRPGQPPSYLPTQIASAKGGAA